MVRPDLNKLMVERERRGGLFRNHHAYRNRNPFVPRRPGEEGENYAQREGMGKRYGWNRKEFNENLNPLYHSIRKAVGRRWDAFYSDLCRVFDMRGVINQHIMQHIDDFIARDCVMKKGEVWVKPSRRYTGGPLRLEPFTEFYVHPLDGVIKKNRAYETYRQQQRKRAEAKAKKQALTAPRTIAKNVELRYIGKQWYVCEFREVPAGTWREVMNAERTGRDWVYYGTPVLDVLTGELRRQPRPAQWPRSGYAGKKIYPTEREVKRAKNSSPLLYCASKRQASRAVLKKHGVGREEPA